MSTTETAAADSTAVISAHVSAVWADDVLPMLHDYIRIPCVSQAFDPDWKAHGHQDAATEMIRAWCAARDIAGLTVEVMELPGLSPLIVAVRELRSSAGVAPGQ